MTMLRDSTFTQTANKPLMSGADPRISELSAIYGNEPAGVPADNLLLRRNVSPQIAGYDMLPIASNSRYQGQGTEWLPLEGTDKDLSAALTNLYVVDEEAQEKGLTASSDDVVFKGIAHLLKSTHGVVPWRYEVYPMSYGKIAIDVIDGQDTSVLRLYRNVSPQVEEETITKTTDWTIMNYGSFVDAYSNKSYTAVTASKPKEEVDKDLSAALTDLYEVAEEAQEKGFTAPSDVAFKNAERLLKAMYAILPWRYEVYPMSYGNIAIDAPNGQGASVIALCESNGGAMCLANLASGHRGKRYASAADLPNAFLGEALLELRRDTN